MIIVGVSAFYHDSAVAVIKDGEILFAAQEERFSRKKHDSSFPELALAAGLKHSNISADQVDYLVFYEKPFQKFDRLMSTYAQFAPRGLKSFLEAMPVWFKQKLFMKHIIAEQSGVKNIAFVKHHEAHAGSAFFPSPFRQAVILTVDGVGEWDTLTTGFGRDNRIKIDKTITFPHSLGLLYSAFTYFTGFRVNSGEYKLMGLSPYGEAKYVSQIYDHLIDVKADGSFRLNLDYFNYHVGLTMTNDKFSGLFGAEPRKMETPIRRIDMDLAASVQVVLEEILEKTFNFCKSSYGGDNICLAGGVALNCVANGKLLKKQIFKNIWIQPAAGDAGGALGAALYFWHQHQDQPRVADDLNDKQQGSFLGPVFSRSRIADFLQSEQIPHRELSDEELADTVADLISAEKVIGLFNGRMEYGPRALGHRSIIGDARSAEMQKLMNVSIKFRESFRPFAPSVMEEHLGEHFDSDRPSPYMLLVYNVLPQIRRNVELNENRDGLDKLDVVRSTIPAVTHVDYSARIHSVNKQTNPFYHAILEAFYRKTGCPVIINTSFNVRGEPIVHSPEDAYRCFKNTNMDCLLLENFLIEKTEAEKKAIDWEWIKTFPLD